MNRGSTRCDVLPTFGQPGNETMKQAVATMAVWLAVACGPIADASAAPIFADDFNRAMSANVDSNNEGALIDNVVLSGTPSALRVRSVPEPGSVALAGLALMPVATLGRRTGRVVKVRSGHRAQRR